MSLTIPELYYKYYKEYSEKYGKICLLFEVGSFYEFYNYIDENGEHLTNIVDICNLLNITHTRKNKSLPASKSNPYMAGYPSYCNSKYIPILIEHYTVILYEQISKPPNVKRKITQIISKSTQTEYLTSVNNNYISSIFLEKNIYKDKINYMFSQSIIDYSTGVIKLYQKQFLNSILSEVYENIYEIIESYNPSELIFNVQNLDKNEIKIIKNNLESYNGLLHFYEDSINKEFLKINYQNNFLKKIYNIESLLSPIEYLNLEYYQYALLSFILLINFTELHDNSIIKNLNYPEIINENNNLILHNDSIYQLNILHHYKHSKISSLYNILNKYIITSIGKRELKNRLLHPITNVQILNDRYECIESCLNMTYIQNLNKNLKEISDIERLQRKISLNNISPYEYYNLNNSYENILNLYELCNEILKKYINNEIIDKLKKIKNKNYEIFNFDELSKFNNLNNIETNIFNIGLYKTIDDYFIELNNIYDDIEKEGKRISDLIEPNSDFVKCNSTDRDGYYYETTIKRGELAQNKIKDEYKIKKTNNNIKLFSNKLKNQTDKILFLKENIKKESKILFCEFINNIYDEYNFIFNNLVEFIGIIDISVNNAKLSLELNYSKPNIIKKNNSYVEFKNLRHPIIEYISDEIYIGNDISLGVDNSGILLYGINAVGKSSLSKSICLNIILAQTGLFVSCDYMSYSPYSHIFTRINANDNLFKNQSTFIVEMTELKSILKFCDNNSLMIGDEICKGSEELSALSILSSSIKKMSDKNTNFILATHFHQLYENPKLLNNCNIKFKHLTVEFNSNGIIYNRKLKDGVGDNLYGLEVAKYILNDTEFINNCYEIRNILLNKTDNNILEPKISNYNKNLYMNNCIICNSKNNLDTHHIKEQNLFENYEFEKNKIDNLVVLCKKCHDNVHHGNLIINGYKTNINGKFLDYYYNNNISDKKNKKYNDEQINIIKNIYDNKKTKKILIKELKDKHNIIISITTFNKIINNQY